MPSVGETNTRSFAPSRTTLFPTVNFWFMGVNENIPGRNKVFMLYAGALPLYRQTCADVTAKDYAGFVRS